MKNLSNILIRPHITEKATVSAEKSFKEKYKLSPVKIKTVTIPAKNVFVRGKKGKKSGYKKAYIYLKKGEKIEVI